MNKHQEESLFFYVRNDYLIVNNLLVNNVTEAIEGYKLAYRDGRSVMHEALEVGVGARWSVTKEKGQVIYDWYKNRYPAMLNEKTIKMAIERGYKDIKNLTDCMSLSNKSMTLYRNINIEHAPKEYVIGQTIKLSMLLSTSMNACENSFWGPKAFERYVLNIPKGTPMIQMCNVPKYIVNEADEVLLPPLEMKVRNISEGYGDCQKVVELSFVRLLQLDSKD